MFEELLSYVSFSSLLAAAAVDPIAKFKAPVHYTIDGTADWSVHHGILVYPLILLTMRAGMLLRMPSEAREALSSINAAVAALLVVLQVHASLVSIYGPGSYSVPAWLVPVALAILAAQVIISTLRVKRAAPGELLANTTAGDAAPKSGEKKQRTPPSARALIRSLSSPDNDDNDEDAQKPESVTPVRGRKSVTPRKTAAARSPRATEKSPRAASKSPRPRRTPRK